MNTQWSPDGTAVKIWGNYSPHPVIVLKEVVDYYGGDIEETFHAVQKLRKGYLPRVDAGESFPFSMRDIQMGEENRERGTAYRQRYWRFGTIYPTPTEYVRGYYHLEGNVAVFSGGTRVTLAPDSPIVTGHYPSDNPL